MTTSKDTAANMNTGNANPDEKDAKKTAPWTDTETVRGVLTSEVVGLQMGGADALGTTKKCPS
jgi:hypothetical protein